MPAVEPGGSPGEAAPLLQTLRRDRDSQAVSIHICPSAASDNQISHSTSSRHLHTAGSSGSNAASSSGTSGSGATLGTCRICFETETQESQDAVNNPLISPCLCSGGSKFVHRQCLQQWRTNGSRADAYWVCEVCKYRYRYRRLWWAGLLGSNATLLVLFLLLMSALIALLGFVPVLNLLPSSSKGSGGGGSSPGGGGSSSSPAPGGGGGGSSSGSGSTQPMWLLVSLHVANGLIMMGIVGLVTSIVLGTLRACGVTGLMFMPDPFFPGCLWCLDVNGAPGLGWAPFLECSAAGECGLALVAIVVLVMLVVGIMAASYMLYAVLWALVQHGLDRAQHMVENVQQEQGSPPPAAEAKH